MLIAALRSTRADLLQTVRSVKPLMRSAPARDEMAARQAVRQVERIADHKGLACVDQVDMVSPFVRKAALKLADSQSADAFVCWATAELEARAARHQAVIAVWRSAADAAPSLGMIGTVLGLIGMFAAMEEPARLGSAMALAMLTTLYGLLLGTIIFGSAAARLERLATAERAWQQDVADRLERLARADSLATAEWLKRRSKAAG